MKITIDKEKCLGCGSCSSVCGDVFELGEDQKAHLKGGEDLGLKEELETTDPKCSQEAVDVCPVGAIEREE